MNDNNENPTLAFALFASTAAAGAIAALSRANLIDPSEVANLHKTLDLCRQMIGSDPTCIKQADLLEAMLRGVKPA